MAAAAPVRHRHEADPAPWQLAQLPVRRPRYDLAPFPILFQVVTATRRWPWSRRVPVTASAVAMAGGASRVAPGDRLA